MPIIELKNIEKHSQNKEKDASAPKLEVTICKLNIKIEDPDKKENREVTSAEINNVSQAETHETVRSRTSTRKHQSTENTTPLNTQK